MQIPIYPRPSNPDSEIEFVMPNVEMGMSYCSVDASQEEALTTRYLNDVQKPGDRWSDSATWTAQDRRTALWWIFTNSRIDTMLASSYECKQCGEIHFVDTDMRTLDLTGVVLAGAEPEIYEGTVQGEPHTFTLVHLDGRAMEHLEGVRNMLPPEEDPEWRNAWINLRVMELAHQIRLPGEPDGFMKAAEYRYDKLRSMQLDSEFPALCAAVQLFNREQHHGLDIYINKGVTALILPPVRCKNAKEGEAVPLTPLHMPFRPVNFLPSFRFEWLGFTDE